jgi:hypothetical protein
MLEGKDRLIEEENEKIRRFRVLVDLTRSVIYQDTSLELAEAIQMVSNLRRVASVLFPGKEGTFDLILQPRFDRVLRERFGEEIKTAIH